MAVPPVLGAPSPWQTQRQHGAQFVQGIGGQVSKQQVSAVVRLDVCQRDHAVTVGYWQREPGKGTTQRCLHDNRRYALLG